VLRVVDVLDVGADLVIIQLKEKEPFTAMMDFTHPELANSAEAATNIT
jgi:hypothetical protein